MAFLAPSLWSQERAARKSFKNAVTIEPLYVYGSGMRVNYERMLAPKQWIETSLTGYKVQHDSDLRQTWQLVFFDEDRVKYAYGVGGDVHYKYMIKPYMYFSAGVFYRFNKVNFIDGNTFKEFEEDGLKFYEPAERYVNRFVHRYGTTVRLGYQSKPYRRVTVGGYVGLSYIRSRYNGDSSYGHSNFYGYTYGINIREGNVTNLHYSGLMPVFGFRIGVRF
jgi:hypothetical protein